MGGIVDPIDNSCPPSGTPPAASVTSSITYDGATLFCLGIDSGTAMNAAMLALDKVCQSQSALITSLDGDINIAQTDITNVQTTISALDTDSFDFAPGIVTLGCLVPASESLTDVLIALEAAICALQVAGGGGKTSQTDWQEHIAETNGAWIWTTGSGLANVTGTIGFVVTLDDNKATGGGITKARVAGDAPALDASKDNYIYHDVTSNTLVKKVVTVGAPAPASAVTEVVLYNFTTNGSTVTATEDLRIYTPIKGSSINSSQLDYTVIPDDTITSAMIAPLATVTLDYAVDLSGSYTARSVVDKGYVDTQVAAVNASPFGNTGVNYYYDAGTIGIGTLAPDVSVSAHIEGSGGTALKIVDSNEALGRILTSSATGIATWQAPAGQVIRDEGVIVVGGAVGFNFIGAGVTAVASGVYTDVIDVTITGSVASLYDLSDVNSSITTTDGNMLYYDFGSLQWDSTDFMYLDHSGSKLGLGLGAPSYTLHVAELDSTDTAIVAIYNTHATPAIGVDNSILAFTLNNDLGAGNESEYAHVLGEVLDPNNASIDGTLKLGVTQAGVRTTGLVVYGDDLRTLAIGDIVTSDGKVIKALTGGSQLDLRNGADNAIFLSNDSGAGSKAQLYFDDNISTVQWGDIGILIRKDGTLPAYSGVKGILLAENTANNAVSGTGSYEAMLLNSSGSTVNINVVNSVIVGGTGIIAKTDNTVYVPQLAMFESGVIEGVLHKTTLTASRGWILPDETGTIPVAPGWDALIATPTVTEDGYAITWNNANNEYELTASGGGGATFYSANGTLAGARTINMNSLSLGFTNAGAGVSIGSAIADSSAILDLVSTTEGLLPPRMTNAQMLAITAATGLMVYDTDNNQWMGYNGTSWVILG